MKKNLFCTPVWQYQLEDAERINTELRTITQSFRAGKDYFAMENTCVKELYEIIRGRVLTIVKEYDIGSIVSDVVITGRQNPIFPGECDTPHHHPDSILVGVYYLTVPEKSGDILLHDPRGSINWPDPDTDTDIFLKSYRPYYRISPKPGTLLFFPGYLLHSVETNQSHDVRISIAINVHNV